MAVCRSLPGSQAGEPSHQFDGSSQDRRLWARARLSERGQQALQPPGGHEVSVPGGAGMEVEMDKVALKSRELHCSSVNTASSAIAFQLDNVQKVKLNALCLTTENVRIWVDSPSTFAAEELPILVS